LPAFDREAVAQRAVVDPAAEVEAAGGVGAAQPIDVDVAQRQRLALGADHRRAGGQQKVDRAAAQAGGDAAVGHWRGGLVDADGAGLGQRHPAVLHSAGDEGLQPAHPVALAQVAAGDGA